MDITSLLRDSMQTKPVSKRGARQKTSTPKGMIRMNYNENPYGMSDAVKKALVDSVSDGSMYQDFFAVDIKKQIAAFYGLTFDNVAIGSGSSALIDMIGELFLNYGDEVVYCMPSYEAFPDMVNDNGGVRVEVPLTKDYCYDLAAMRRAVTDKTKIAVVVNPNNPTGTYVKAREVEKFIRSLPPHVITVVDEAYFDYVTDPDHYSMIRLIQEGYDRPLIVLRTLSKIYGLAGIRFGYAIANADVIDQLLKASSGWNVSRTAITAASAALKDQAYVRKMRDINAEGRKYLYDALTKLGCYVAEPAANFLYFDAHRDNKTIQKMLEDQGILIGAPGTFNRVSLGTKEQNRMFVAAMKEILAELPVKAA